VIDSQFDLVVIGGGPAGIAATSTAASFGLKVAIIDERATFGGQIFKRLGEGFAIQSPDDLGKDYARGARLIDELDQPRISEFTATTVLTIEANQIITSHPVEGVRSFNPKALVIAPGAYDRPVVFPGWTLPGVMTAGAVQTLVKTQQISPGKRIFFAGSGPLALAFSAQLIKYGAPVFKVIESAPFPSPAKLLGLLSSVNGNWDLAGDALRYRSTLLSKRVPFHYGRIIIKAEGSGRVEEVTHARVDRDWNPIPGTEVVESADTLCLGYGFFPSHELFRLLDCNFDYDETRGGFTVAKDHWGLTESSSPIPIYAVGDGTGVTGSYSAEAQGRLAGLHIANHLGSLSTTERDTQSKGFLKELNQRNKFQRAINKMFEVKQGIYQLADANTVICRCESVKAKEIDPVIDSTCDLSVVKSYSRAGMGLCQARNCQRQIAAMIAKRHDRSISEINFQTPRMPVKPVEIGKIADPSIREEKYFIQ